MVGQKWGIQTTRRSNLKKICGVDLAKIDVDLYRKIGVLFFVVRIF
jgi:hypothetical protein